MQEKAIVAVKIPAQAYGVDFIDIEIVGDDFNRAQALLQAFLAFVKTLPKMRLFFTVGGKKVTKMQMLDSQSLTVAISAEDSFGNPTSLDPAAVPAWALSDASFGSLVPAADNMSAVFSPNGKLGDVVVQVSIPAVNSEPALVGSLPVTIAAGSATQIALTGTAQ